MGESILENGEKVKLGIGIMVMGRLQKEWIQHPWHAPNPFALSCILLVSFLFLDFHS